MSSEWRYARPLRLHVPKVLDIVWVAEPDHIRWLNQHPQIQRPLDPRASWLHRILARRASGELTFDGASLPQFHARDDAERADRQRKLEQQFESARVHGSPERDEIAAYISDHRASDEIGVSVQQWCGRLFFSDYRATSGSYEAGKLVAEWPERSPLRNWLDRLSGRLERSKHALDAAARHDLYCVHGTSHGMRQVTRTVRALRTLRKSAQAPGRVELPPSEALRQCLAAPSVVLRGCARDIAAPFLERPLTTRSLVVFLLDRAFQSSGDLDIAFLADTWSRCPAHRVVPAMLRSVWYAAHQEEADQRRLQLAIHSWSRIWQRSVS